MNAQPIIVPDNYQALSKYKLPPSVVVCNAARENIKIRIMLYSKSVVNFFAPAGPFSLSLFISKSKSIMLNYGRGGIDNNPAYLKKYYGYSVGDQPSRRLNGFILWYQTYPEPNSDDFMFAYNRLDK